MQGMKISELLLSVPQRETAGEESDDAFAFQKSWAIYSILSSHLLGDNYLYIFEYHDDLLRLDSEDPTSIEFVQIKKSDKNSWTVARLTKRPEGGGYSIVGKLYSHVVNFPGAPIKLRFVSDMHFNFSAEKIFHAGSIKQEDQKVLSDKIEKEHNALHPDLDILWFEQCVLSFDAHAEQLLGAVEKFIVSVFGDQSKIRATALCDTLLRRSERSRYSSGRIKTFAELKSKKGFGRYELDQLIHELRGNQESSVTWEDVSHYVEQLTVTRRERLFYKGEFLRLSSKIKVNPDDVILSAVKIGRQAFVQSRIEDEANTIINHFRHYVEITAPGLLSCFKSKQVDLIGIITFCETIMSINGDAV